MKVMDKHEVCRKTLSLLKKNYSTAGLKPELPVLETLLYACCLENASPAEADAAYARVLNSFHDLNEIRVSSIYELEKVFDGMEHPEWRALRIKSTLQHVFETTYSFDYESLKRKTHDLAVKQLGRIKSLSPFVRSFTLQNALGSHILPIDDRMLAALVWLRLAEPGATPDHAAEALRSFVRKADAQLFCHLLRSLATDPRLKGAFSHPPAPTNDDDPSPVERLEHLIKHGPPSRRKEDSRKSPPGKNGSAKGHDAARKSDAKRGSKSGKEVPEKGTSKKATVAKGVSRATQKKPKST